MGREQGSDEGAGVVGNGGRCGSREDAKLAEHCKRLVSGECPDRYPQSLGRDDEGEVICSRPKMPGVLIIQCLI